MPIMDLFAFALDTPNQGYHNQMAGAIAALLNKGDISYPVEKCFLKSHDSKVNDIVCYCKYKNYKEFCRKIFAMIDDWQRNVFKIPRVFITCYDMTIKADPYKNADMLCRAVKEYYKKRGLGEIFTVVLTSKLHNYKYVDLINVPKHLLTFYGRIRLLQNKKLRKKTLITIGTIHQFSYNNIIQKKVELDALLKKTMQEPLLKQQQNKLKHFIQKNKKIVICLGGRVEGNEIIFDLSYAKNILEKSITLAQYGYGVAIINGPRTPNDITDLLYEKSLKNVNILFCNSKRIAANDKEKNLWYVYSGKYEREFSQLNIFGNLYPALLGYNNTLAVHSIDSYACCETISAGIPTAISSEGIYIDKSIRGDCFQLQQLLIPKYALNFEDFISLACYMKIEPKNLHPAILSDLTHVLAEAVQYRMKSYSETSSNKYTLIP